MIPNHTLSTTPVTGFPVGSKSKRTGPYKDYEDGGISLNNTSQGLLYQEWVAWIEDNKIYLKADNITTPVLLYSGTNVNYITFTFDQNMNLIYLYRDNNIWYFVNYDNEIGSYTTINYPNTYQDFQLILDDKRSNSNDHNDVLLFYIENGSLKYRIQRDRYLIPYTLANNIDKKLIRVNMNDKLRLQFSFGCYYIAS